MKFLNACHSFLEKLGKKNFFNSLPADLIILILPVVITLFPFFFNDAFKSPKTLCSIVIILLSIWALLAILCTINKSFWLKRDHENKELLESLKIENMELVKKDILSHNSLIGFQFIIGKFMLSIDEAKKNNTPLELRTLYNYVVTELFALVSSDPNYPEKQYSVCFFIASTKYAQLVSRKSFDTSEEPDIYEKHFSRHEAKEYIFGKLLYAKNPKRCILADRESIIEKETQLLKDVNPSVAHYSQYIGIPISKNGSYPFAYIEIIAFNDSRIWGETHEDLSKFVERHVTPLISLVRLACRFQN